MDLNINKYHLNSWVLCAAGRCTTWTLAHLNKFECQDLLSASIYTLVPQPRQVNNFSVPVSLHAK